MILRVRKDAFGIDDIAGGPIDIAKTTPLVCARNENDCNPPIGWVEGVVEWA
jgi:hypothetical protein